MKNRFLHLFNILPSIAIALLLAIAVWIVSISEKDPTEERRFTNNITIELVGLGDGLVMTNSLPEGINLKLRAPQSVWQRITNDRLPAKATIDVTNLSEGSYHIPIKIEVGAKPIMVASYTPNVAKVTLEKYATREFDVMVAEVGEIPTAFQSDLPVVDPSKVIVGGSVSLLEQIDFVRVVLDHANATDSITRDLNIAAIGKNGTGITTGLTYTPDKVNVKQNIYLRGGYRVVVVKVVTAGSVPEGYRVAKISVDPSVVTVYSSDSALLESIPSYVETDPIDLSEFSGDVSVKLGLKLPERITLVGDQSVKVEIQINAIEGANTYFDIPVYVVGLEPGLEAQISPELVNVYLSGPQPILSVVKPDEIYAVLDLQNYEIGHYQLEPKINIGSPEGLSVQSIIPGTIDVRISKPNGSTDSNHLNPLPAPTSPGRMVVTPTKKPE